jgi:hypothetical protein
MSCYCSLLEAKNYWNATFSLLGRIAKVWYEILPIEDKKDYIRLKISWLKPSNK